MSDPKPGDTITCKINDGLIGYNYIQQYDQIVPLEVVCVVENGYLVKIPTYINLKNSFELSDNYIREYNIPKNFKGAEAHFINDDRIVAIKERKDGETCDRCKEYFPYAAKNDLGEFKCFLCRQYRFR